MAGGQRKDWYTRRRRVSGLGEKLRDGRCQPWRIGHASETWQGFLVDRIEAPRSPELC